MDYKKYSLENLENWLHDALSCGEASPHEIYSVIRKVVQDEYNYHKEQSQKCFGLLELLSGHRPVKPVDDGMRPWGHSDLEYMIANPTLTEDRISNFPGEQYTEEELNAMCDKAASDDEKQKCREYNLREAEYYDKRARLDAQHSKYYYDVGRNKTYEQMITEGWEMTDDGFWIKEK